MKDSFVHQDSARGFPIESIIDGPAAARNLKSRRIVAPFNSPTTIYRCDLLALVAEFTADGEPRRTINSTPVF
jgi:hypothetical protein